jgi:hypothetical protein
MGAAQIASLILAVAKLWPEVRKAIELIERRNRDAKANELHDAINEAIARAQGEEPVCPRADCPMRRLRDGAKPS